MISIVWLVAGHPGVVAGRDVDDRRGLQLDGAPVRVLEVERAVGEEADVGVLARRRADQRPQVDGPAQPGWVDRSLDARIADAGDVDLDRSERLVLGAGDRGEQRGGGVHGRTLPPPRTGVGRPPAVSL